MHKSFTAVLAGLLLAASASASEPQRDGRRVERAPQLRVPREIVILYQSLSALPFNEQRAQLRQISPAVRAQLWGYNVRQYVQEHPALTATQRALLDDALDLLATPALFEPVDSQTPGYNARQIALRMQRTALEQAFSRGDLRRIILRLGSEPVDYPENPRTASAGTRAQAEFCECQTGSDECFLASSVCIDSFPMCEPWIGCGLYGTEACDGVCH